MPHKKNAGWDRRRFLQTLGASALMAPAMLPASPLEAVQDTLNALSESHGVADDEAYWAIVRQGFALSEELIFLNHGGVSPTPLLVHQAHIKRLAIANQGPSYYYLSHKLNQEREPLRERLAQLAGCSPDELALNRNTTEGLATVIQGLNLGQGDEVVLSRHDYPSAIAAWEQRERRDGIVLRWANPPVQASDSELTQAYTSLFSDKTRIVHLTHVTNWTGQTFPARMIADAAHAQGVRVLLDAAHSFAAQPFSFADTGADYAAASLHKWLCAPYGTGILMVRKPLIATVWPLLPAPANEDTTSIHKFEHLGTRSFATELAVHEALDFHEQIGLERKQQRLRYLKHYWASRAAAIPNVSLFSPYGPDEGNGIATFAIAGHNSDEIYGEFLSTYKIHTSPVHLPGVNGVRVTPHVFTTPAELEVLVQAIRDIAAR